MKRSLGLFFLLPMFLMHSCVQAESLWSLLRKPPLPSWIIDVNESSDSNLLHLVVNERVIWETGDDVFSLAKQITSTLQAEIDGKVLPTDEVFTIETFQPPIYEYDDEGNLLGSHYGPFDVVIFVPENVSEGLHKATVQVTSTSGIIHSYSWYFVVSEITPNTGVN